MLSTVDSNRWNKEDLGSRKFSVFDFNSVSEHRPSVSHRRLSKLSALPHIQVGEGREQACSYSTEPVHSVTNVRENSPSLKNNQTLDKVAEVDENSASPEVNACSNVITLGMDLMPAAKGLNRVSKFHSLSSLSLPARQVSIPGDDRSPRSSDYQASSDSSDVESPNTHYQKFTPRHNHRRCPDIAHSGSAGRQFDDPGNMRGISKRLSDLHNAVLINNWIKILESTQSDPPPSQSDVGSLFDTTMSSGDAVKTQLTPSSGYQRKMAHIDLTRFFDLPESALREFDQWKHLSHVGAHPHRPEKPVLQEIPVLQGAKAQNERPRGLPLSQREPQQGKFTSYTRSPQVYNGERGLMNLLDVQGLKDTRGISHGAQPSPHSGQISTKELPLSQDTGGMRGSKVISTPNTNNSNHQSQMKLQFKPKTMKDSFVVNPVSKNSNKRNYEGNHFKARGQLLAVDFSDGEVQNLLLQMPSLRAKEGGPVMRQSRVQGQRRALFPFHTTARRTGLGKYPDLSISGSSMLDMSMLKWQQEMKELVEYAMKRKCP